MLSEPKIERRPDQPFAAIALSVDRADIPDKAPPLIGEVASWLAARGIAPTGAPFFNYLDMSEDHLVMHVGFPTAVESTAEGRVVSGSIPAGRFATLTYTGPYDGLFEANAALGEWLRAQGIDELRQGGGPYDAAHLEIYETDPAVEPDASKWVTEVAFRLGD